MRDIKGIKVVTLNNFHEIIPTFISANKIVIDTYEDMEDTYLRMIKSRFIFTIDRELLTSILVEITYMYNPGDDLNKDRVLALLTEFGEEDDSDDEEFDIESLLNGQGLEDINMISEHCEKLKESLNIDNGMKGDVSGIENIADDIDVEDLEEIDDNNTSNDK